MALSSKTAPIEQACLPPNPGKKTGASPMGALGVASIENAAEQCKRSPAIPAKLYSIKAARSAATVAENPLSPRRGSARSSAWASESVVSTPNPIGTLVSS